MSLVRKALLLFAAMVASFFGFNDPIEGGELTVGSTDAKVQKVISFGANVEVGGYGFGGYAGGYCGSGYCNQPYYYPYYRGYYYPYPYYPNSSCRWTNTYGIWIYNCP